MPNKRTVTTAVLGRGLMSRRTAMMGLAGASFVALTGCGSAGTNQSGGGSPKAAPTTKDLS